MQTTHAEVNRLSKSFADQVKEFQQFADLVSDCINLVQKMAYQSARYSFDKSLTAEMQRDYSEARRIFQKEKK